MFPPRLFPSRLFPRRLFPGAALSVGPALPLQARSNIARSGVTRSDLLPHEVIVTINGTVRGVMPDSFSITHTLGQASQFSGRFNNDAQTSFEPQVGQTLIVADESSQQRLLFGGTIMSRTLRFMELYDVKDPLPRKVAFWDVQARDWSWLMDKQSRVYERFENVNCRNVIERLLDRCDPALGMRVGIVDPALGDVTRTFDGETVTAAIGEVAQAVNAYWRIGADKRIDLFREQALDGNPLTIVSLDGLTDFTVKQDLDQIRTLVDFEGGGAQTTAAVAAGATEIPVAECSWYTDYVEGLPSPGLPPTLKVGHLLLRFGGRSTISGPGVLTQVREWTPEKQIALSEDIPQGTAINILVRLEDLEAQDELHDRLGLYSGVVAHTDRDTRLGKAAIDGLAAQNLTFHSTPLEEVTYGTEDRFHWPGKFVSVSLTTPATYARHLRLHSVTTTFRGVEEGTNRFQLFRTVTARPGKRATVLDLFAGA